MSDCCKRSCSSSCCQTGHGRREASSAHRSVDAGRSHTVRRWLLWCPPSCSRTKEILDSPHLFAPSHCECGASSCGAEGLPRKNLQNPRKFPKKSVFFWDDERRRQQCLWDFFPRKWLCIFPAILAAESQRKDAFWSLFFPLYSWTTPVRNPRERSSWCWVFWLPSWHSSPFQSRDHWQESTQSPVFRPVNDVWQSLTLYIDTRKLLLKLPLDIFLLLIITLWGIGCGAFNEEIRGKLII